MESIREAWDFVSDYAADGFIAVLALGLVGPWLGAHLIARRAALSAFAAPWFSAAGIAAIAFAAAPLGIAFDPVEGLSPWMRHGGAAGAVFLGLALLALAKRFGFPLATCTLVSIVLAAALRELLFLESPLPDLGTDNGGQILLMDVSARNRILGVVLGLSLVLALAGSRILAGAIDPDRHRARGGSPRSEDAILFVLLGTYASFAVPELGLSAALALLVIPPALLLRCAPSWRVALILGSVAGPLGVAGGFVLSVARDWPPGSSIVLALGLVSGVFALAGWPLRR